MGSKVTHFCIPQPRGAEMNRPASSEGEWTNILLRSAGCLEHRNTLLSPVSELSKDLCQTCIHIWSSTSLQAVKWVFGRILCPDVSPHPAAVTMALLSGSLTWSAISKTRHMNPGWRSLMRKKCPISPLISPWKTRSIEMGSTGMTSKWTEFALMHSNWNKFLESSFFLFH